MIRIANLNIRYASGFDLSIESLSIKKGEIAAIIGPNGAGKTTLLNSVAMFETGWTGMVEVFGKKIDKRADMLSFRRRMSFVFSRPYVLNRTVYENIALPLRLRGDRSNDAVEEMLALFKITHLKHHAASGVSQGERYRVSLARAFITNPELVLLDEPFLSLDQRYKQSLINELHTILKKRAVTALFVSQDHFEVLSLADRIILMKDGRVIQQGVPQDIFSRPISPDAASFVGVETIVDGTVVKKEDNLCSVRAGESVIEAVSTCDAGDSVLVCIRPEDVFISREGIGSSSIRNHFKGVIASIEPWGLQQKLIIDCGFKLTVFVTRQSLEHMRLMSGETVCASCKATAVHLIKR